MCQAIAEGSAVDVIEMDAASHTSVDDAREIIERVQFRPAIGRTKVYIIDEVHMLSTAAFNALLKTLEEPPQHAMFILATTEIHKVPATILSRCQRYTFNRHTVGSTAHHLKQIALQEGYHLEDGVAEAVARAATGSMRDALSIFDQLMSYGGGQISMAQVQGLLGVTAAQEIITLTEALMAQDVSAALRVVGRIVDQGGDIRQFSRDVVQYLRSVMLFKADPQGATIEAAESEIAALRDQATRVDMRQIAYWLRQLSALDQELRTSAYDQLPLELALVEAIAGPATPAPAESSPRSPAPRPSASAHPPAPAPPRATANTQPPSTPSTSTEPIPVRTPPRTPAAQETAPAASQKATLATVTDLLDLWPLIVRDIRAHNRSLEALIKSGITPVDVQGETVVLKADNEWLHSKIQERANVLLLEQILERHTGMRYRIRSSTDGAKREQHSERDRIRDASSIPLVKTAMNVFDADVINVAQTDQGAES
jgi:DNA polymerase-3 subunit gamma/tau